MIDLILFSLGIILILGISRYNENDKLFWKLFISFVGTFAAATFVYKYIESQKQNKTEYYQSAPTQVLYNGPHNVCVLADPVVTASNEVKTSDPVSKDYTADYTGLILSKVYVNTRGQPVEYIDDS
jgi:hypothetical protein